MKSYRLLLISLSLMWAFAACNEDEVVAPEPEETFADLESDWIRLAMVTGDNQIGIFNPSTEEFTYQVEGTLTEGARYYISGTGRYLVSVERVQNQVRFFDSGIENHEDHGHEYQARWLDRAVASPTPTHFAALWEDIVIFNDGDGSILHVEERRLEFDAYQPTLIPVADQHHGAAVKLDHGLFVVTFRDPALDDVLPQRVMFVDEQGQPVGDHQGVQVGRIHGNASNGEYAAFGSTDGIIIASTDNEISLIPNTEGLNAESGNWVGIVKGHDELDVFYGWARNKGIYKIDPVAGNMSLIYEGNDIKSAPFFCQKGEHLILHKNNDEIIVFDAHDGSKMTEAPVSLAQDDNTYNARKGYSSELERLRAMNEPDRVLGVSGEFLYALEPSRDLIKIYDLHDMEEVQSIQLDSPVENLFVMGFVSSGEGGHYH
ncbi:MAG: hypothetical protein ACLFUB_20700 [Cyclobacteriaceae bacterium]